VTGLSLVWLIAGVVIAATWLASVITRDSSWVDRIWSVVPVAYLWVFAVTSGWDARVVMVAVLVTLWGVRLTYNFARKGGYAGVEDYRWPILRARMRPWQYQVFQLLFICGYQNVLLVLITLPAWTMSEHQRPLGGWDWLLAVLFLLFLTGETIADQQQWEFHQRKGAARTAGQPIGIGFLSSGLFRYSRHPNFFFEQAQWWVVFGFAVVAAGSPWLPTVIGAALLTLLFLGSTLFTESLSAAKYPEYAGYRRRTSMLIPWPPRSASSAPQPSRQD
jgi:steroid 5-alpha reductase family enzyme